MKRAAITAGNVGDVTRHGGGRTGNDFDKGSGAHRGHMRGGKTDLARKDFKRKVFRHCATLSG